MFNEETIAHGDFGKWIIKNISNRLRLAEDISQLRDGVCIRSSVMVIPVLREFVRLAITSSCLTASATWLLWASYARKVGSSCVHISRRHASRLSSMVNMSRLSIRSILVFIKLNSTIQLPRRHSAHYTVYSDSSVQELSIDARR
jgi:hypothetical protein